MPPTVDITGLNRLAEKYARDLKYLPYYQLSQALAEHKISIIDRIQDTDKIVTFERKAPVTKPYDPSVTLEDADLGKMIERPLKVELAYSRIKDNIQNYKEKTIIRPDEMVGSNKTHKHPFQIVQMMQLARTFGEDLIDALFTAQRSLVDNTPQGLFDGFETLVLAAIVSGEVAVAEGNQINSGSLAAPADENDYTAYENLVAWLRQADPLLRKNCILYMTEAVTQNVWDAMQNKRKQKANDFAQLETYLKNDARVRNLSIIPSYSMGTGERLYLSTPNNMDFGMNSKGDDTYVKMLDYPGDPNLFYLWMQGSYGTRWQQYHKKAFLTNTGSLASNPLSGDYLS